MRILRVIFITTAVFQRRSQNAVLICETNKNRNLVFYENNEPEKLFPRASKLEDILSKINLSRQK